MTDRVDPVPIDPLRSGGIFRLNKAGLHAHPHVRTPAAAVPPGLELIAGRDSNGAGGVAAVPAPFNAAYSARVRARFNELYRATPIPVSILYDTPIGRMGGMSAASVGSADSNATTVVQSPALVHVSPVVLSMPADKGLGDIQLPVKEVAGTLDLFSPPVSSRRHYRSSRDGSAESAARNATRKLVDEDMVAKSDSLVETVVSTPSPSVAKQAQMGPRAIKRVRPELVSPQSAEQSPAEGKSTGAVRSSTSLAIPAASQLAQAPTGTAAMQSVAVKTVAATSCSREKDAEEEDLGEDDSYGSGSEDEIEDFDGLGEFLERALADADSEEEDKTERKKESNTIANNSVIDRKVNINFVSEQRKVAPQQSASTGMALSRTQTPVSDSRAAVEIKTVMVDVQSPAVYAAPKHALVAQPRGRGAMQVNSFLSNLPPPPAPATKLNSNSLISSSKSTPPPVKADMLVREIHSAPPLEKAAKVLAVQEQKKKSSEPQVHGGLRFVQLRDLSSSSDEDSVGMYPSKTQKKDKSAQKAVASPKLTKKPSMQNGPTDSRKMILESGVIVEASNSSNKKKAPNEVLNEKLARATLPNVSKKKAPVANHVVDLHPQQKVLDGDTGTADIRKKKKSPIQVAKVQNQIPQLENECRLSSYIAANIPVILLGGDQSVWSAEELSVLKEAHNLTPLNDPNFWMHVTEIVNEWRKSVHAKNFELRSENGPAKRKGGRKKSDHIVTELPPLVLRTASDCQGRWFQSMQSNVMDHKLVKNSKSVKIYDDIEDTIDTKKPIKRLTKAKIRQIMGMAVIGKPDDIFDALDDSGITRGRSVSSTAVNYYKKRDRSSSADAVNTEYSGEKRRKTQSITPGSTPGRVLRSGGKSIDTPALKKMDKSEKKKAMIYTPEDLEIQRQSDTSNTPQLADRISTRSTRSSPADPDIGLEEVKRYLYERPQACASVGSYNENNLSNGAAWTASYANNLSKRKAPIASAVNLKPMKKKKSLSAEGTFHSKTDVAVIEALRDRDAGIAKRNSKSPTGWRPKPSGRVRAIIDSTSGRVITSIDDGGDSDDESDVDDADDE